MAGYRIPVDNEGKNMLTNQKDGPFTISEIEVSEINGYMETVDKFVKMKQEKDVCKNQ